MCIGWSLACPNLTVLLEVNALLEHLQLYIPIFSYQPHKTGVKNNQTNTTKRAKNLIEVATVDTILSLSKQPDYNTNSRSVICKCSLTQRDWQFTYMKLNQETRTL